MKKIKKFDKNNNKAVGQKPPKIKIRIINNFLALPILLWVAKKSSQIPNTKIKLKNVTFYMYKNEKNLINLEQESYKLKEDRLLIAEDTQSHLPESLSKNSSISYFSKNLRIYKLSNNKEIFVNKWFKISTKLIKYFSSAISGNYVFIVLDFKDMYGNTKKTEIERIEFNSSSFVQRVHMDELTSENCTRSIYIPSQKVIARICTDGYRVYLRRNLLRSNILENTIVMIFNDKKDKERLENFKFIVMPTNNPLEIKYLVYEVGSDDIMSVVSNRYITKHAEKIQCSFKIKEMFYIGNMILLIKTVNDEIHFKEIVFGSFTELEKWKYLLSEGSYVNSYFSLSEKSLIIEILNVVKKDQILGKTKIQDFDIIAFKYDKNAKSFALFKRWMPSRNYQNSAKIIGTTFKKISRINSLDFIISMIQEEFTYKPEASSSRIELKNISLISSNDYSLNYKPNQDISIDSFADEIINIPSSEAYISFFKDSFSIHTEQEKGFKKCMLKMDILQKPRVLVGWNLTQDKSKMKRGVAFLNTSFWAKETSGNLIPGSRNYTFMFNDTWEGKKDFIWEEKSNTIGSYTIFTGIPNRLDMINYVRGSFIARRSVKKADNKTTVLPNLSGPDLYKEKDFEKLNDLMMLTFLSSINSRMNFFKKSKVHEIDTLFSLSYTNSKKKESFIIIRKYHDEPQASVFRFTPNQFSQNFLFKLKEHGRILKVAQYDDNKFIFLRKGGRIFLFKTPELEEAEINFPGKPCMHMFFIQHSKIKLTLLCVENDLKISLYYADELINGWTSKSTVAIAKHQVFKKAEGLTHNDVKVLMSQEFSEMIYIFAKDRPRGESNLFIYDVAVGITVDVLGKKELEIKAGNDNSTESKGKLFDYKIKDVAIVGRYLVMLLKEADESIWVSVKLIEGGVRFTDMKLVKLDSVMRISSTTKIIVIENHFRGILSRKNMSPLIAFKVSLGGEKENVVIFDPAATSLESIPFMLLPDDEENGILTFPVYSSSISKISSSIGVVRYQVIKDVEARQNNLVHIFIPLTPSVQIKGTANLDISSIFETQKDRNINEDLFFINYLDRHKNHDPKNVTKNVNYNYVEGDKSFHVINSGQLTKEKNITKKIDLRGFTDPKTGEINKESYIYKYKISDAIKGNIVGTNFTAESLLEQVSEMIKFHPPVVIHNRVNVSQVKSQILEGLDDVDHERIPLVSKFRMPSLAYTCVDGELKKYTKAVLYECKTYSLVFLTNHRMVAFKSKNFKIKNRNAFINPLQNDNIYKDKVDIKNSDKIIMNFNEFEKCSNLIAYLRYVVMVCDNMGSMRIDIIDTVSMQLYSKSVKDKVTGKINQIKLRMAKDYLIVTSFSVSTQRYIKIWIYQLEEITEPDLTTVDVEPRVKTHFIKSLSMNSVSYKVVIHNMYEGTIIDKIYVFSVDCLSGRVCSIKRDGFLIKNHTDYDSNDVKVGSFVRPIEFRLSDKYEEQVVLMTSPRIYSLFDKDLYYIFLYVHFGVGRDYIFKISTDDSKFDLYHSYIFRLSNPFFGVSPVSFKTPRCKYWCCISVATYAEKSFVKFYEINKESLSGQDVKPYGFSKEDNKVKLDVSNNIGDYGADRAFHTLYVLNITGRVEEIVFDPQTHIGVEKINCLILKSNGEILNITVHKNFLVEINNLYLSSRDLRLDVQGKVLRGLN